MSIKFSPKTQITVLTCWYKIQPQTIESTRLRPEPNIVSVKNSIIQLIIYKSILKYWMFSLILLWHACPLLSPGHDPFDDPRHVLVWPTGKREAMFIDFDPTQECQMSDGHGDVTRIPILLDKHETLKGELIAANHYDRGQMVKSSNQYPDRCL